MRSRRKIEIVLGMAIVIVLLVGSMAAFMLQSLNGAVSDFDRAHLIEEQIEVVLLAVGDAKRSLREFSVTRDARSVQLFTSALSRMEREIALLDDLVDLPAQRRRLLEVVPMIRTELAILDRSVELRQVPDAKVSSEIARRLLELQLFEQRRSEADQRRVETWSNVTTWAAILGTCFAIGLAATALVTIKRSSLERSLMRRELELSNQELSARLGEQEKLYCELQLLNDSGELLQACNSLQEALLIIERHLPALFPATRGAIYITNSSRNLCERVVQWPAGDLQPDTVPPSDCWSLRRGRIHMVSDGTSSLCGHMESRGQIPYVCAPMSAHGETLGFLTVAKNNGVRQNKNELEVTRTVSEQISLALSNLRLRDELRSKAIRDPLTGLYNRRHMEESLDRELIRATRHKTSVGVMMIDVDHFKLFNDTYGHDGGDAVLQEFGALLRSSFRGEDIACRWGGEEFVLVLPDATLEAVLLRADRLREDASLIRPGVGPRSLPPITISIGISAFPDHGVGAGTLISAADHALYRAKREGRNRVVAAGAVREGLEAEPADKGSSLRLVGAGAAPLSGTTSPC